MLDNARMRLIILVFALAGLPLVGPFSAPAHAETKEKPQAKVNAEASIEDLEQTPNKKMPKVEDIVDFHRHTLTHAKRVQLLGIKLRDKFFLELDRQLLHDFLALHDNSKLHGAAQPNSILHRLFAFYGKNASDLQGPELLAYQQLSQEIAEKDKLTASVFILSRVSLDDPNYSLIVKVLLLIERLADAVDRSKDPTAAEEFGRPMRPVKEVLQLTRAQAQMVQYLETIYSQIYLDVVVARGQGCQKILEQ